MSDPPSSENEARAEQILDAAMGLIVHYGYDKTSVADIAREAGVAKGTIYLHWRSKDALFRVLLIREETRLVRDWFARVKTDPEGVTLASMYRHSILALAAYPLMQALYTRQSRVLGDYVRRNDPAIYRRRYADSLEFVRQLQAAGLVRTDVSAEVVNHIFTIISCGFMATEELLAGAPFPPLEAVADALAQIMQRALAPEQPGDNVAGQNAVTNLMQRLGLW
jgi:TetR/AcrR family acrAB operon transcriptional repressor